MLLVEEQLDSHSTEYYSKEKFMPKLLTNGCSISLGAELGETTEQQKRDGSINIVILIIDTTRGGLHYSLIS